MIVDISYSKFMYILLAEKRVLPKSCKIDLISYFRNDFLLTQSQMGFIRKMRRKWFTSDESNSWTEEDLATDYKLHVGFYFLVQFFKQLHLPRNLRHVSWSHTHKQTQKPNQSHNNLSLFRSRLKGRIISAQTH